MDIEAKITDTTIKNRVSLQRTGSDPLPDNENLITSYGGFLGRFYIFLSWFHCGPGAVKVTDAYNRTMYLDKTELKNWIDSKLKHITYIENVTDKTSVNRALRLILDPISQIGQVALSGESASNETNLNYLRTKIEDLKRHAHNPFYNNLAKIYQHGLDAYQQNNLVNSPIECYRLNKKVLEEFNFTAPVYLREKIKLDDPDTSVLSDITGAFYDYRCPDAAREERYFVDFANESLGGLDGGFFQEEIMFAEAPVLVDLRERKKKEGEPIALRTRNENSKRRTDGPGQGNPAPLLVKNVHRVGQVNGYGSSALSEGSVEYKKLDEPQKINVLAMAAPRISGADTEKKYDIDTLKDLFNTFVAGFRLAKEDALKNGKKCVICTGKIGCGAFGNDPSVVYALQMLAAKYVGVDQVVMHGFVENEAFRGPGLWHRICGHAANHPTSLGEILEAIPELAKPYVKEVVRENIARNEAVAREQAEVARGVNGGD